MLTEIAGLLVVTNILLIGIGLRLWLISKQQRTQTDLLVLIAEGQGAS